MQQVVSDKLSGLEKLQAVTSATDWNKIHTSEALQETATVNLMIQSWGGRGVLAVDFDFGQVADCDWEPSKTNVDSITHMLVEQH